MRFDPQWYTCGKIEGTEQEARNEPMLFSCDGWHAAKLGGPLTASFLIALQQAGMSVENCVIDSRVHMLKPGWFPCIPGWHLDDFQRGPSGQPDFANLSSDAFHVLCIIGDASRTEFLDGPVELRDPLPGEVVYDSFNRQIRRKINECEVGTVQIDSNVLYRFRMSDFHRGTAATKDGWRWFIRASFGTQRKPVNEVRKQAQVYLPWPEAGW